jgi:hypothetical protein
MSKNDLRIIEARKDFQMTMDTIARLVDGTLVDPDGDGKEVLSVPTQSVVIANSLKGK